MLLEDGKYEFVMRESDGVLLCRRHGQEWREFVGDKAVTALFQRCRELEAGLRHELGDELFEERF